MRLAIASMSILGILSGFLLVIVLGFMLAVDLVSFPVAVALVILMNLFWWLVSPFVQDLRMRWLHSFEWITLDELRQKSPASADVIEDVTTEYGYSTPKLGIIKDSNPNAFTYGSGRWNSRIVVTEGLFEHLEDEETASVYAHELGHITNRDFIIMTIAATLIELLYLAAVYARRMAARQSGGGGRGRAQAQSLLIGIAILSYIFYIIGRYLVLYLSRVREYYADQFAARFTHPNLLSSSLVKIAYGIAISEDSNELTKSVEAMGIMNVDSAEDKGVMYHNCQELGDMEPLKKSFLFDFKNPWAKLLELSSTHPLTGKRVKRLSTLADDPMFDFDDILRRYPVDTDRLRKEFLKDFTINYLPTASLFLGAPLAAVLYFTGNLPVAPIYAASGFIALLGMLTIIRAYYKYPSGEPVQTTVMELMSDVYASPVRGRNVVLDGELIGRGQAGYVFSEDMMFKDETGLMYLKYHRWFPFGNLLFAMTKVEELIGNRVRVDGWFLRGTFPWIGLQRLFHDGDTYKSDVRFTSILSGAAMIALAAVIIAGYAYITMPV